MNELVAGGNVPLPDGAVTLRVPGPFDLSVIVTDDSGKVAGDGDFVFYNQPATAGARLQGDTVTVDGRRLRAGASRVTVAVSPAEPGTPLGRLPVIGLQVHGPGGLPVAHFTPPRPDRETVLLLAEIYRRGPGWKLRALGQGYADGLAGVARDFGVDVAEDEATQPPTAAGPPLGAPMTAPTTAPTGSPATGPDGFLPLVNAARASVGAPPVTLDARLTAAASAHAAGMAARAVLSSEHADGTSLYQRVVAGGYAYLAAGEHLVSGPRTPADFVEYCLSGEQSRRTVLSRAYTQVGVAHTADARSGDVYWTALWATPFSPQGLAEWGSAVLRLTNAERTAAGLRPLSPDPLLTVAAQGHSADMIARAFYAHTSPDGGEPWHRASAAGSTHRAIGENIACGQRTPAEVVDGWMNSPGHRANILGPSFTHLGVGFAGGGSAGTYWTQLFGG
ncbi:CAP domain-containing protein [Streptomyces durmitorensis]|uniref:CAP domain-containing protein n=1 Tax=Streptomyces durmitorensis TaxID=319947 RepID=A0ABY4PP02_9ACTN|nr:CAP domain-containing protein [Streptomyces durmitorensis]UQT54837.1 CAP domain-containing protein [Streptomyces durmitorensis]